MTDAIQAADLLTAINSRLQAIDFSIGNLAVDKPEWGKGRIVLRMVEKEVMPHVRSLAALVREYGHVAGCECKGIRVTDYSQRTTATVLAGRDPRCLPESREEKP